jgi:hypothetical protein
MTLACSSVLLASLAACDSGTWVDIPGIAAGCTGGKPSGLGMKSAADVKLFAQGMCAARACSLNIDGAPT